MLSISQKEKRLLLKTLDEAWGYAAYAGDIDLANRIADWQTRLKTGRKLEALDG